MMRLHHRSLAGALVVALVLAGCTSTHPSRTATPADRVTFVTAFGSSGRDAYPWVAAAKGFFRDQGLEVTIQPGAAGAQNVQKLAAGKAQFAAVDFGSVAYQIATGKDTDLRMIAAIQQRTVTSIITLTRTHITSPRDLAGKTIGSVNGSVLNDMFAGYAKLAGLDPNTVHWQYMDPAQLAVLLSAGRVDAVAQYLMAAPTVEQAAHCTGCAVVLPYSTYLADPYGAVLITTNTLISAHRDLAARFRTALLQGLAYAITHPDEAGQILNHAVPTSSATAATGELKLMAPYVTAGDQPVGNLDRIRVARGIASLASIGMYPSGLTPEQLVDFSFTPHNAGEAPANPGNGS